jgi:hypothetical protein
VRSVFCANPPAAVLVETILALSAADLRLN